MQAVRTFGEFPIKKTGDKPKLYVGSGTNAQGDVRKKYERRDLIPGSMNRAFQQIYTITNYHGLLCWAPMPPAILTP